MNSNETCGSTIPLIINGEYIQTNIKFDVISPTTGAIIYQCSSASADDANQAAVGANVAFQKWSKMKPVARRDLLWKAADIFERRKEEFITYQQEETGASKDFAGITFHLGLQLLKDFAGRIPAVTGTAPTASAPGQSAIVIKEPYGVVLGIAPWNAPLVLGMRAIVLPLAAGNTVVLKGSELSPKTFWALGDVFMEAALPTGCVNVIYHQPSDAHEVTSALIAHPTIKKISFTGSTRVGSLIGSYAGRYIKPVLLELGGKASCIILDDANLEKAATDSVLGSFMHSGQICMSTERIIVLRSVADKFRTLLVESAEEMFGEAHPPLVLVTPASVNRIRKLVSGAESKGASILFGTIQNIQANTAALRPIIIENVTKAMDLYYSESFGPVVSIFTVDTEQEAIMLANDTEYGLSAAIYTENLRRGLRIAQQIESGAVHLNSSTVHDESALPHGGYKSSGFGRFGGADGFDEFLQTKSITWMD